MIILLYGQDSYRSQEKLNQIIEKYKQSDSTQSGLFVFNEENFTLENFTHAVVAQSFFSAKKLLVIKNIFQEKFPKDAKQKLIEYLKEHKALSSDKDTVIVFWYGDTIKASDALYKLLTKKDRAVKKQEFKKLSEGELKKWIRGRLSESVTIHESALSNLILYTAGDLWRVNSEIQKLAYYKEKGEIRLENVDAMVSGNARLNVFQAIDALGRNDWQKAIKNFRLLLDKGEDPLYLFSMIVYQLRNLIKVKSIAEHDPTLPSSAMARQLKMHPFVAQKTLQQARMFSLAQLQNVYARLLEYDLKIKTGKTEPALAIDLIVYSFATRHSEQSEAE